MSIPNILCNNLICVLIVISYKNNYANSEELQTKIVNFSECKFSNELNTIISQYISFIIANKWNIININSFDLADLASSLTSQYIYGLANGSIIRSTNYGQSFNLIERINHKMSLNAICASKSGRYIYGVEYLGYIYKSIDFGLTFSIISYLNNSWINIACSKSGQHIYVGTHITYDLSIKHALQGIFISNNFGATFVNVINSNGFVFYIICSYSGQYVYVSGPKSSIYKSINYGLNFTIIYEEEYFSSVTTSSNGRFIYGLSHGNIYKSMDY